MRFLIIAHNTLRETVRDKVLRVIIGLCLTVILLAKGVGFISLEQDLKVIADFLLAAVDLFGVVLCIFVGTSLIYHEIEKRTLYTVLARPLKRWEFVLGKYFGMVETLALSTILMSTVFALYFLLEGGQLNWIMLGAVGLIFVQLSLLAAIALLFSTISSPTVSAICTVAVFLIGRWSYQLKMVLNEGVLMGPLEPVFWVLYYVLPNLKQFDVKLHAIYHLPIDIGVLGWAFLYGLLYSFGLLYLSVRFFEKRNL